MSARLRACPPSRLPALARLPRATARVAPTHSQICPLIRHDVHARPISSHCMTEPYTGQLRLLKKPGADFRSIHTLPLPWRCIIRANPARQHIASLPKISCHLEGIVNRKSTSFWIKAIISVVIGLACYLALQQSAQAGSSQPAPVFASPIPGNIMVYRVGDGIGALVNTGNPVFVDEYTTGGVLVQSIPMPTTVSGANRQLIASGTATSEGFLTLSSDNQYLRLTGYASNLGRRLVYPPLLQHLSLVQ